MASARSFAFRPGIGLAALMVLAMTPVARAEYRLCNRTGYILDAALAIETAGGTATQGWFRILPGACSAVLSGAAAGERFFVHTRTPPFYGERPEAAEVSRMFCVLPGDFLLPGATSCDNKGGALAAFTEVAAERDGETTTTLLTDGSGASLEEARNAAIARLLAIAGYAPGRGDKLPAALAAFKRAHGLSRSGVDGEALFDALYRAAEAAARGAVSRMENEAQAE
ncbi:MAG: DUF1036 domain-containing protein [Hyphomicrobiales bacterium]|nr:DUF1036 domain-containing protein [Hyphomicrobiales bacterium]